MATEELEDEFQQAWDDIRGREFDAAKVRKARTEEVADIQNTNLCTNAPRSKATQFWATVITVRWGDISNGVAIGSQRDQTI